MRQKEKMREALRETVRNEREAEARDGCDGDMKHGHYCLASEHYWSETECPLMWNCK